MFTHTEQSLVQPILVGPDGDHLDVITTVMRASVQAMLRDSANPAWAQWLTGPFTKSVRQVNAAQFRRAAEELLPELGGFVIESQFGATAAAFPPMRYEDFPKLISRARVAGLEHPRSNEPVAPSGLSLTGPLVALNGAVTMSTGKAAAQASHALMAAVLREGTTVLGPRAIFRVDVAEVDALTFARFCLRDPGAAIRDAGFTEVDPGTVTATFLMHPESRSTLT